jgi:hypothetical protein
MVTLLPGPATEESAQRAKGGPGRVAARQVPRRTRRPTPRRSEAWSPCAALAWLIEYSRITTIPGLAAAQRVRPADDLDAIAASWPVDDDPDALDAFIRDQRRQRRKAAQGS